MLLALLEKDGLAPRRKTVNEYSSPCPACGGRDRLVIHADTGRYWCRQCGRSGDAVQYLRDFQGMTFREAAVAVGKGTYIPSRQLPPNPQQEVNPAQKEQLQSWRNMASKLIDDAHAHLMCKREAMTWLQTERGISRQTADRFSLGWINSNLYLEKQTWGIPADSKKLFVPSGLVIPWQDKRIRIRRDNPGEYGRYHVVQGSSAKPFEIGTPYETAAVILESELDGILLSQEIRRKLFIVALGSAAVKPDEKLLEKLEQCPVVLIALDTDTAGGKAALWWLQNVSGCHRTVTPTRYGKDISEAFMNGMRLNDWLSVSLELHCDMGGRED